MPGRTLLLEERRPVVQSSNDENVVSIVRVSFEIFLM
jgi:hypothetical protein